MKGTCFNVQQYAVVLLREVPRLRITIESKGDSAHDRWQDAREAFHTKQHQIGKGAARDRARDARAEPAKVRRRGRSMVFFCRSHLCAPPRVLECSGRRVCQLRARAGAVATGSAHPRHLRSCRGCCRCSCRCRRRRRCRCRTNMLMPRSF